MKDETKTIVYWAIPSILFILVLLYITKDGWLL